jgi:hypothetical protein
MLALGHTWRWLHLQPSTRTPSFRSCRTSTIASTPSALPPRTPSTPWATATRQPCPCSRQACIRLGYSLINVVCRVSEAGHAGVPASLSSRHVALCTVVIKPLSKFSRACARFQDLPVSHVSRRASSPAPPRASTASCSKRCAYCVVLLLHGSQSVSQSLSLCLSLSHTHTHSLSYSQSRSIQISLPPSLSHPLSATCKRAWQHWCLRGPGMHPHRRQCPPPLRQPTTLSPALWSVYL